jgi:putative MATE family efflux protein
MTKTHDLTTGSLAGHFLRLALPAAIGMVFSTLYNVVDVFFAGLISTDAQAGLAISFQAFFIFVTVGFGLGSAMTALVGNAIGAKNDHDASLVATQGVGFAIVASGLLMAAAYFIGPHLLTFISTEGAYRDAGAAYFTILLLSLPAFVIGYGLNGLLQAQGDTVSMQYALIGAFFANIGLNPLMMFGIPGVWNGLGFDGIAAATVISQTGVMIFIGIRLSRSSILAQKTIANILPNLFVYRQILAQLLPTTFTMLVMFTAGFIVQFYLKSFGTSAVAAYGVALRVEQLFLLPVFGLTGALLPIAAQNFGAGERERVRIALFTCWKFGWLFMLVACPTLYFAAPLLMRSFTPDPDVIAIGVSYLRVDGFILPIYMMLFAINSFLQALKRPMWTLLIGIYRQAFGVAFFSYIFVHIWGFGVVGVWYGIATSVLSGLILSLIVAHHASIPLIGGIFSPQQAGERKPGLK